MRILFLVAMLFLFVAVKSQSVLSPGVGLYPQKTVHLNNNYKLDSLTTPKWFFSTYQGISTSMSFFKGGHASVFSAPMGLQLNRRFNNNLFGFANISISPSYINFNSSYLNDGFNKGFGNNNFKQNTFGVFPSTSLGLMYINDARTFSISGSVSAERRSYPIVPYFPLNSTKQNTDFLQRR